MASGFHPLPTLLRDGRAPTTTVAVGRVRHDFAELAGRVETVREHLAANPGRWLLFCEDTFSFTVGLLAVAHARARAVLPPNTQTGTLERLCGDVVGAIAEPDASSWLPAGLPLISPLELPPAPAPSFDILDPTAPLLELHTSGSTGESRPIPKSLAHLAEEVDVLEERFGSELGSETPFFATVSHQHLYGLLFRTLWPLASGRPFCADTFLHPEELIPRMVEGDDAVLVATPVHLRRMQSDGDFRSLRGRCRVVFSSGGLLDAVTAAGVADALGQAPWEIFGSTETGGVAVRRQSPPTGGDPWLPQLRVAVDLENGGSHLRVQSPFVSVGEESGSGRERSFVMGDRVELAADGSFQLLGRGDRVVKVGEKRLSLPEMEEALRRHPWVNEVALVPVERGPETRTGAVVCLSEEGVALLASQGRRAVSTGLAEALAPFWDRVLLPRAWRYVPEIPRDRQGKTPQAGLRALFEKPAPEASVAPVRVEEKRGERVLERRLRVPRDLVFLEGHFEAFPLVAGVVQIHWVMDAARELLGSTPRLRGIEALKFPEPLLPEQPFHMSLELSEAGDRLRFRLFEGSRVFSSGRCILATEETKR